MGVINPQPSLAADTAAHLGPAEREKGLLSTAVGQKKEKRWLKNCRKQRIQRGITTQNHSAELQVALAEPVQRAQSSRENTEQ